MSPARASAASDSTSAPDRRAPGWRTPAFVLAVGCIIALVGFGGLVVLATNLVSNIDPAFMRRIDIAIDYVLPEETERRRLWEISFPAGAPLHDDVDLSDLAAQFKIAGGSIRKAALYAAFLAAEDDTPIRPDPISLALEREYKKLGRLRPGR